MGLPNHVQEKRNELVEQVVADIKEGKPFFWDCEHYGKPSHNIVKGSPYRGLNRMRLLIAGREKGFTDSRWGTYRQAQEKGWQVKKGEKGTHIEWWTFSQTVKETDQRTGEETEREARLDRPMVKNYVVFNAQQMEGVPEEHPITIDESQRNEYMENMLKNSEAKIFFDEAYRNYYSPTKDEIHVLPREKFKTLDAFYATCVHEIAHSTGHESRLNRNLQDGANNQEEYAKEELRAELTSMFIAQDWGLTFDESHYQSHEAYLQSWAKVLESDPNELYRAAAKAQEMADYIEKNMLLKGLELPKAAEQTQEAEQEQSAAPVMAVAEGKAVEPEKAPKTAAKRRSAKYKVNVKAPKKDKAASMGR